MLEALMIVLILMSMAKARPKRKFRRYLAGQVDEELALGTLNAKVVVSAGFDQSVEERTWASSMRAIWSLENVTLTAGVGPVLVGVAHSDYTAAEIEAWIENTGSWSEGDLVSQEVAKRKIRKVGIFDDMVGGAAEINVLNEGRPIRTKLNWILTTGQSLQLWAYNLGTASFATTDPTVDVQGIVHLWPR